MISPMSGLLLNQPGRAGSSRRKGLSRIAGALAGLALCLAIGPEVAAAPCPEPAASVAGLPRMSGIDQIAQQALSGAPLAGLSIAVMRGSDIIHAAGYGQASIELGAAAGPDTVYRVGSLTKQFTAAAVLRLAELGALRLEDDIRTYIPAFDARGRTITIRQLLDHTSGIRSLSAIGPAMLNPELDVTREQVLGWLSAAPFDFEPGERYRYNNSGYWLLGLLIETLTGETYGAAIRRLLTEPLCLASTRYDVSADIIPHRASGYVYRNGGFSNAPPNSPTRPYAAGALLSSVLDLVAWQHALFGDRVLSASSVSLMTTPSRLDNGQPTAYGMGLSVSTFNGRRRIAHPGGIVGFSSFLSHYPETDITIAVLSNTMGVELRALLEEPIAELLMAPAR